MSVIKPFTNNVISDDITVTDIPSGVVSYKIKQRVGCVATIILRYKDGVEQRYLEVVDETTVRPSQGVVGKNTRTVISVVSGCAMDGNVEGIPCTQYVAGTCVSWHLCKHQTTKAI